MARHAEDHEHGWITLTRVLGLRAGRVLLWVAVVAVLLLLVTVGYGVLDG